MYFWVNIAKMIDLSPIRMVIVSHGNISDLQRLQGLVCDFIAVWIQNDSVFLPTPVLTNTKVVQ